MLGRMFGVVLFAAFALAPLGMAGALAAFSVTLMLILAACIMSLSGLAALVSRTVRTIE